MGDEVGQTIWNSDAFEAQILFEIKSEFMKSLLSWDLENAYWKVRALRMELDAKLIRKGQKKKLIEEFEGETKKETIDEKTDTDSKLNDVETVRKDFNQINNPSDDERGNLFLSLENFYMHLCYLMKKHGIYFREGDDYRLAVLRR